MKLYFHVDCVHYINIVMMYILHIFVQNRLEINNEGMDRLLLIYPQILKFFPVFEILHSFFKHTGSSYITIINLITFKGDWRKWNCELATRFS